MNLLSQRLKTAFTTYCLPAVCSVCKKNYDFICKNCLDTLQFKQHHSTISNVNHIYFSDYTETLKSLMYSIKFDNYSKALTPLQEKLRQSVQADLKHGDYDYWIPIPYHPLKTYQRGYDIIKHIFSSLFEEKNIPINDCLIRTKHTKPLSTLSPNQRSKMLSNCFLLSKNTSINLTNKKIALVDDIVTTQTTMQECLKILMNSFNIAKIECISLIKA